MHHGGQREQAKAEWISLFCLQILFVLRVFDRLNLLRYCGIKVYGSKEKQCRFLQVLLLLASMAHSLQSLYKACKTDFP